MNALRKSLLRIRALIKKEFLAMFRDKGTRMVLIVPVLVQAIIFGYGANFKSAGLNLRGSKEMKFKSALVRLNLLNFPACLAL